jgi:hypothetical protein
MCNFNASLLQQKWLKVSLNMQKKSFQFNCKQLRLREKMEDGDNLQVNS